MQMWTHYKYSYNTLFEVQLINNRLLCFVGDHIQGAFNISRTPRCGRAQSLSRSGGLVTDSESPQLANGARSTQQKPPASSSGSVVGSSSSTPTSTDDIGDCGEIGKMQAMAVYFLHNKERSRSYYNLDVRNTNGTQKRVRSRDLPWGMKQVSGVGDHLSHCGSAQAPIINTEPHSFTDCLSNQTATTDITHLWWQIEIASNFPVHFRSIQSTTQF